MDKLTLFIQSHDDVFIDLLRVNDVRIGKSTLHREIRWVETWSQACHVGLCSAEHDVTFAGRLAKLPIGGPVGAYLKHLDYEHLVAIVFKDVLED